MLRNNTPYLSNFLFIKFYFEQQILILIRKNVTLSFLISHFLSLFCKRRKSDATFVSIGVMPNDVSVNNVSWM